MKFSRTDDTDDSAASRALLAERDAADRVGKHTKKILPAGR